MKKTVPLILLVTLFGGLSLGQTPSPTGPAVTPRTPSTQQIVGRLRALERRLVALEARVVKLENQALSTDLPAIQASNDRLKDLGGRIDRLEVAFTDSLGASRPTAPPERLIGVETPSGVQPWPEMPYGDSLEFVVRQVQRLPQELPQGGRFFRVDVELVRIDETVRKLGKEVALGEHRYLSTALSLPAELPRYRLSIERLGGAASSHWLDALAPHDGDSHQYRCVKFIRVPKVQSHHDGYDGRSGTVRAWRGDLYWHQNDVFFLEDGDLHLLGEGAARHHIRFLRPLGGTAENAGSLSPVRGEGSR